MIRRFHLNFSKIPAVSTRPAAQKHQKGPAIALRTCFLLLFGRTAAAALVSRTRFSAVTRTILAPDTAKKTQLPDAAKDFPKERLRHCHFCHLEHHISRMLDYN